jgi:hypothetical protein
VVLWTALDARPYDLRAVLGDAAAGAAVQPPFTLPFHRGPHVLHVNWAILYPAR